MCPVMSFTTYMSALNPNCDKLWQQPRFTKFKWDEKVWYGPTCQNNIDQFIMKLCDKMGIKDRNYTNHSLRVSGITNFTRNNFSNKQIMSISGHKSMESLAIYQKVNQNEKIRMGLTLGYSLLNPPSNEEILAPAQIKVQQIMPREPVECPTPPKQLKIAYEPEDPIPQPSTSNMNMTVAVPEKFDENAYELSDQELL